LVASGFGAPATEEALPLGDLPSWRAAVLAGVRVEGPFRSVLSRALETGACRDVHFEASSLEVFETVERLLSGEAPSFLLPSVLEVVVERRRLSSLLLVSTRDGGLDDDLGESDLDAVATVERLLWDDLLAVLEAGVLRLRLSSLLRVSDRLGRLTKGPDSDGTEEVLPREGPVVAVLPPEFAATDQERFEAPAPDGAREPFADLGVETDIFALRPLTDGAVTT
jgi:hypothetical protein